jgi:peptidoglycan/xylan/chitin deacetylase (PgdA/CDA1 family)
MRLFSARHLLGPAALRVLRRVARPKPAILMYHRVADLRSDPWALAVRSATFAAQLDQITRTRTALDMATFVAALRDHRLPPDAIALTFDDGYYDNLEQAEPLLAAAGVQATLFVIAGMIGQARPFWWDELAQIVLDNPRPFKATVPFGTDSIEIAAGLMEAEDHDRSGWRAWNPARTRRERLYTDLWMRLRDAASGTRHAAMDALRTAVPHDIGAEAGRAITAEELRGLDRRNSFAIGAHTMWHGHLPSLDNEERRHEICGGRRYLEDLLGHSVEGFAYPYGAHDGKARQIAVDTGFKWACSTRSSLLASSMFDLFDLPRIAAIDNARLNSGLLQTVA